MRYFWIELLTGLLFGSSPAWQLSRPDVGAMMQSSSIKLAGSVRGRNVHRILIVGQVTTTSWAEATARGTALQLS